MLFQSLKARLMLLLVMVALPGIIIVYNYVDQERQLTIEHSRGKVIDATRQVAFTQQKLIQTTRTFLEFLAASDPVKDPANPSCSQYLAEILQLNSNFVNIGVPGADGELRCNALPLDSRVNVADRGYFKQSLRTRTFSVGTFQHDRAAERASVNFSYPVLGASNSVVGLVVAVVSLDRWSEQLSEFSLPEGSIAVISDFDGTVVANFPYDPDRLGVPLHQYGAGRLDHTANDYDTELVTGADGIRRVYTHATLYSTPDGRSLVISVGVPFEQALKVANRHFYYTLVVFMLLFLAIVVLANRGVEISILEPLRRLSKDTQALAKGYFKGATESQSGAHELVELQALFQEMAENRLEAETAARSRHEELNSVFDALPDLYFRLNREGVILDYRASTLSDLYVSPDQFLGKRMDGVLPEAVGQLFNQKLSQHQVTGKLVSWEYPLEVDGREQIFEARLNSIQRSDEVVVVVRNITERKEAEGSRLLATLVYENSSEGMVITDAGGRVLDINPAFTQSTGYELDEVAGKDLSLLKSGRHDELFYEDIWRQLEATGRWQGEIINRRKDGEIFPEWLTIDTVYNEEGTPARRVALYRDITEKKKADEMIWRQAHFDSLTGLPNRNMLYDRLSQEIKKSHRSQLPLALVFVDLDHFKEVNDTLGHDQGDLLLKEAAKRLQACVREGDTVARQGGDEFMIVLGELNDLGAGEWVAEKILMSLGQPFELNGELAYVTASIGIAHYPGDAQDQDQLLKAADHAMYAAKRLGRNRFHYFMPAMQDAATDRMRLINDLHEAEYRNEFRLHYQPVVEMSSGRIVKAEALLRWMHPERGMVGPADFIPLAEQAHLIAPIGNWVFNEAISQVQHLRTLFGPDFQVSINISPVQFASIGREMEQWLPQMQAQGLGGDAIVAEITEGVMMDASEATERRLLAFAEAGIQVALDDFGTGYSSLSYIREYDIDYLKIDRSFVQNLQPDSDAFALCEAIIVMAHKLGIKVIAEGIETQQQCDLLREASCDYGQGYLFARPLELEALEALAGDCETV